jgi:hypothetical protein
VRQVSSIGHGRELRLRDAVAIGFFMGRGFDTIALTRRSFE